MARPCSNVDERFRFVHIMLTTDSIGFYCDFPVYWWPDYVHNST